MIFAYVLPTIGLRWGGLDIGGLVIGGRHARGGLAHWYLHASVTLVKADGHGALHQAAPAGALGPVLNVFTGFLIRAP